jgi:uncharacterized membrane-anchored protein YitT (DUF2179 family)
MSAGAPPLGKHSAYEDVQALGTGTLFVALGVFLFKQAGMTTGGTVGLAFLAFYATHLPFGALFFAFNLPFYWLAWRRMGTAFTIKTFIAVALASLLIEAMPHLLQVQSVNPWFAAIAGGLLVGAGLIILFRHHASLGGINVLVLYLQESRGWRAGIVQAAIDGAILLASLAFIPADKLALSLTGMLAMNAALAINHRPGRYMAM